MWVRHTVWRAVWESFVYIITTLLFLAVLFRCCMTGRLHIYFHNFCYFQESEGTKNTMGDESPKQVDSVDMILLQPYAYVTQVPGKQIRAKLIQAFNLWMRIPEDKLLIISEVMQMLHNASLLIDDIEDSSSLRRGVPVAHHIYGVASTINSANYVYFLALQKMLTLNHPEAPAVFTEQLLELHRGQGMDIYWRDSYKCPTEDEYKRMVIQKTGGLFMLAIRLMELFSTSHNQANFRPLTETLGLMFQIRDDYCNLVDADYTNNKSYCEDLTEGKFSFPIIHGIHSDPTDRIFNVLKQRTQDINVKKYCVDHLTKLGSFEYTKNVLTQLDQQVRTIISELGGNEPLLKFLSDDLRRVDVPTAQ